MFDKKAMQLLQEPLMNRCWVCHNLKFAIASQVLIHKSSRYPYRRFICKDCGKRQGLNPTAEYLQNFREMDRDLKAEEILEDVQPKMVAKVLVVV
ncbi:hypothetical protein ACSYAD_19535 [Acaryochloris marina NIES-2412]|uniref:hypothetical protein n=1 Tax=Acaryochloris marina TaxID=155978 RepID=UPI00405A4AC1